MALRDLSLKQEYRSDRDDVVSEFFIPCLTNSIQYDRTIEFISVKSLSTLTFGLENIHNHHAKIRLVSGHRFTTSDLNSIVKLFAQNNRNKFNGRINLDNKIGSLIRDSKIAHLQKIIKDFFFLHTQDHIFQHSLFYWSIDFQNYLSYFLHVFYHPMM